MKVARELFHVARRSSPSHRLFDIECALDLAIQIELVLGRLRRRWRLVRRNPTFRYHSKPVPAGISRRIVTFSFSPRR